MALRGTPVVGGKLPKRKLGGRTLEQRLMLDASLTVLSGQVLWLDANDSATVFDADGDSAATGTGGANDGFAGSVAAWHDKSGNGYNVTTSGSSEPLYGVDLLNGKNTLSFDGIDDRLANGAVSIPTDTSTVFIVFTRDSSGGREAGYELGGGGSRNGLYINNSGSNTFDHSINTTFYNSTATYTPSTFTLLHLVHSGMADTMHINGTMDHLAGTIVPSGTTGVVVGDDSTSGDWLDGKVAEMIVYNRVLSSDERHDVETYLAGKWGLTIADTTATIFTNGGLTVSELSSGAVSNLGATDADNTDQTLVYTISSGLANGYLYNSNTSLSLGIGDTFLQSDINNGYISYHHTNANTVSDSFGFSVGDQYSSVSGTFSITVTPVGFAPVIDGSTQVSVEDFEANATGWSDTTRTNGGIYLSNFLGRHSMETAAQNTYKTYALSGTQDYVTISFDMYKIDSWDSESFIIYVDDVAVYGNAFGHGVYQTPSDGSSGAVSWTIQETTPFSTNYVFGAWNDQNFHYVLTIQTTNPTVKLGFSSTLDQAVADEAWGVDNIIVSEVGGAGTPGPFQVSEIATNGTVIGKITATDQDYDSLAYSITGGTGASVFSINSSTGQITVSNGSLLDYETTTSYTLNVRVADGGGASDTETITINVLDVPENNAPVLTGFGPVSVNENTAPGLVLGTVTSTDPDGDTVTYSITGGNTGSMFAINATTGVITLAGTPNYESVATYNLTITGTDNGFGARTGTKVVTININNLNETPVVTGFGPVAINENSAIGTSVGTVTSTDQDVADTVTYSIVGGNTGGMFTINSATGAITLAASPNFEALSSYTLTVRGTDNGAGALYADTTISVTINDVNETPTVTGFGSVTINENTAIGTILGTVTSSDPDGNTVTYSIPSGNAGGMFTINPTTGVISLASSPDYEAISTYTLTVRGTDNGTGALFSNATIVVHISDVNEAPVIGPVNTVLSSDATLRYNPTTGSFYRIVTSAVTYAAADAAATSATLYGVAGHLATMNSAVENAYLTALIPSAAWIGGSDSAVEGSWRWTGGPDSGQLFSSGSVAQNGYYTNWNGGEPNNSGGNEDIIELRTDGKWNDINGLGTHVYIIEWESSALFASLSLNPGYSINENSAMGASVGTLRAYDHDSGDVISYSVTGGTGASYFAINSATGQITVTNPAVLDFETNASFTLDVLVSDIAGLTDTETITINVNDLNEAPVITGFGPVAVDENTAAGALMGTVSAADQDTADTITYSITGGNTGGMFAINAATGAITLAGSPNFEAVPSYTLTVRATDNGTGALYDETTITISINDLNETPTITGFGPVTMNENSVIGTSIGTVTSTDPDPADIISYSITGGNTGGMFAINAATGLITFAQLPNFEAVPSYTLTVRATDNGTGALYDETTIVVNITDINEAPTDILLTNSRLQENSAIGDILGQLSSIDPDPADTHTYSFVSNPGNKFTIIGDQIVLAASIDYEAIQRISLVIRTDDGNGGTYDKTFSIQIGDQMDTYVPSPDTPSFDHGGGKHSDTASDSLGERSGTIIRETIAGGEAGQQGAFYGIGKFFQIIREKTTFALRDMTDGRGDDDGARDSAGAPIAALTAGDGQEGDDTGFAAHYTNLRQVMAQMQSFAAHDDAENGTQVSDKASDAAKAPIVQEDVNRLAQLYGDEAFVDVMTYHEQKQARLRQALAG